MFFLFWQFKLSINLFDIEKFNLAHVNHSIFPKLAFVHYYYVGVIEAFHDQKRMHLFTQ